ncbi:WXG100 family type VII secretion target [Amycolatopsis sulphurea]|uniref:WXG100 family type VII secretion target n=1 Tax=Amycolatopsis sulphurea TaxID=76022 RepID=UPI000BF6DCC0|nr:WXG100 family type VII secretion target [Amycolatopsis sulphurea]
MAAAEKFADRNLKIGAQPGLIADLVGSHEQAKAEILTALRSLEKVCEASAAELDRAWQMYDRNDHASAGRLDQTYPDPGGPPPMPPLPGIPAPRGPEAVQQTTFPVGRLTEPKADGFTNPLQLLNDLGNLLSPGYWSQKVLESTIGVNPAQEFSGWVAGDWEQFAKASDALNSLSFFCSDAGQDLKATVNALLTSWSGNAANEAFQYFTRLGEVVNDYSRGLADLRDKYREAAQGVWEFSESINDLIQSIFDNVFWAAIEVAAGAALSETVVGAAAFWGLAALECKGIVDDWKQMTNLLMNIQNTIRIIHGGILDVAGASGTFQAHPLPAGYDHPGA